MSDEHESPDLTNAEAFAIVIECAESYRRLANEAVEVVKRWVEYHLEADADEAKDKTSLHLDHRMKF